MTPYKGSVYGEWHRPQEKKEKAETIKFYVEVAKVQAMDDGGVRVMLDLGEDGRRVMEALTECKQNGVYLAIEAIETV